MTRGNAYGVSFIGCNNIPFAAVRQRIITKAVQLGIGDSRKKSDSMLRQCFKHFFLIQHLLFLSSY